MSVLFGQMILGWGLFNLVEGMIDHHLLTFTTSATCRCTSRLGLTGSSWRSGA